MVLRYFAATGRWAIDGAGGAGDAAAEGDNASPSAAAAGLRYSKRSSGSLPDELAGPWQWTEDGDEWNDDEQARVREIPRQLHVSGPAHCEGLYDLAEEVLGNGQPVWRLESKGKVLYSGTTGKWIIGDGDEERKHFDCHTGWVRDPKEHCGALPHDSSSVWEWANGREWRSDASIRIRLPEAFAEEAAADAEDAPEGFPWHSMIAIFVMLLTKAGASFLSNSGPPTLELRIIYVLVVLWPLVCAAVAFYYQRRFGSLFASPGGKTHKRS